MRLVKTISGMDRFGQFTGVLECEHCLVRETELYCEDRPRWHQHDLPRRACTKCGKDRAGDANP